MHNNPNIPIGYTIEQMNTDKKRFGALNGDWAKRCIKCNGRFSGGFSLICPHCLNKEK